VGVVAVPMAVVAAVVVPMAVAAEASTEAVAEATSPVAEVRLAPRAGDHSVAAAAFAAARLRLVTVVAPRTADQTERAPGRIPTRDAHLVCPRSTADHFQVIAQAMPRGIVVQGGIAVAEAERRHHHPARALAQMHGQARRRGTPGRLPPHHVGRQHQQPGLMANGIPSVAAPVDRALPAASAIRTLLGRTAARRVAHARQAHRDPPA
jgi:hypothetical protein